MAFVLLHSPMVGPTTWQAVSRLLRRDGEQVVTPDLTAAATGGPPNLPAIEQAAAAAVDTAPDGGPVVLVGHSGAGPLLPGIADSCLSAVRAVVYVDSLLPQPGASWFDRAPDELADHLRGLARDGVLPPWDEWFEPGAIDALLPDPQLRARFRGELPRLPVHLLAEPAPAAAWSGPSGYLLLSDGYLADAEQARRNGWPVLECPSHHLAMLTEPAAVAGALRELTRTLA